MVLAVVIMVVTVEAAAAVVTVAADLAGSVTVTAVVRSVQGVAGPSELEALKWGVVDNPAGFVIQSGEMMINRFCKFACLEKDVSSSPPRHQHQD